MTKRKRERAWRLLLTSFYSTCSNQPTYTIIARERFTLTKCTKVKYFYTHKITICFVAILNTHTHTQSHTTTRTAKETKKKPYPPSPLQRVVATIVYFVFHFFFLFGMLNFTQFLANLNKFYKYLNSCCRRTSLSALVS